MEKTIKVLYQSKEWKIVITENASIKIWNRTEDKQWRPWMRIYAVPNFDYIVEKGYDKYRFVISDDRVTDDDRQTREFLNASDLTGIQYLTKAPITQQHIETLEAMILAKQMLEGY